MKRFKNLTLALAVFLLALSVLSFANAHALSGRPIQVLADSTGDACNGLSQLGGTTCGNGQSSLDKVVNGVVIIISYIAGVIAIIMIIVSGIRFTTSGGDSAKAAGAKTALAYALIGIAIAALAQFFVQFVLDKSNV